MGKAIAPREIGRALLLLLSPAEDSHDAERFRTGQFTRRWRATGPLKCAICGATEPETPIDTAHIRALEEYGHTEYSNLLPLCSTSLYGRRRNGGYWFQRLLDLYEMKQLSLGEAADRQRIRIGCHDLLDYGLIAKNVVAEVRRLRPTLRDKALKRPLDTLGGQFGVRGKGSKVDDARRKLTGALDFVATVGAECHLITLLRRTGQAGVGEALVRCQRLDAEVLGAAVPPALLSKFYYEYALALQVGQEQHSLNSTRCYLLQSREAATRRSGSWGMSELELVHAEVLSAKLRSFAPKIAGWIRRQDAALACVVDDPYLNDNLKSVWRINYLIHRAKLLTKAALAARGRKDDLRKAHGALRTAWECLNRVPLRLGGRGLLVFTW